jgi:PIN domain nuclease of toxin-antitoxin system
VRLLLDTHIWLWSLLDPSRLRSAVKRALGRQDAELWLSPISVWETLILIERGRVVVKQDPSDWINEALAKVPIREAPLTHEIAIESRSIDVPHGDPADRFIAGTAKVLQLTLVTADENLLRVKSIATLPNR